MIFLWLCSVGSNRVQWEVELLWNSNKFDHISHQGDPYGPENSSKELQLLDWCNHYDASAGRVLSWRFLHCSRFILCLSPGNISQIASHSKNHFLTLSWVIPQVQLGHFLVHAFLNTSIFIKLELKHCKKVAWLDLFATFENRWELYLFINFNVCTCRLGFLFIC